MKGTIVCLCDYTGIMAKPWVDAGYKAVLVDPQHAEGLSNGWHDLFANPVPPAASQPQKYRMGSLSESEIDEFFKNLKLGTITVPEEATLENIQVLSRNGGWHKTDESECHMAVDVWNACRAAMLQHQPQNAQQNIPENIPCPKCGGRGSYHCPQMLGTVECECNLNSPGIPDGWTTCNLANDALVMLDRIDTLDPDDDARIEEIKKIIRNLAAAPQHKGE